MISIYDDYAKIGNFEKIGDNVEIGERAKIGYYVDIGNSADIGDHVKIGNHADIGYCAKIGNFAEISAFAEIGNGARIGNFAEIGNFTDIGDNVEIGERAKIGYNVNIGDNAIIGDKFRCEGLEVIDFFTMSNVDGTGRRIHIYVHTEGITIRAGCFKGTMDEFCEKAEYEGKFLYARTVRAAAEAFAAEIHRQGKTGGWDK